VFGCDWVNGRAVKQLAQYVTSSRAIRAVGQSFCADKRRIGMPTVAFPLGTAYCAKPQARAAVCEKMRRSHTYV